MVTGIGVGLVNSAVAGAALAAAPENAGMASGAVNTFRQLGYAFGVAVFGTVATARMARSLAAAPNPKAAACAPAGGAADALRQFFPARELYGAFASGLDAAYVVAGGIGLLAGVLVLGLVRSTRGVAPRPPMRAGPGRPSRKWKGSDRSSPPRGPPRSRQQDH